jgi:hypothetical protein
MSNEFIIQVLQEQAEIAQRAYDAVVEAEKGNV